MMAVSKSYSQYARFMLAYGVGARTQEGNGSAVDLCSMTGDFADPFLENQEELLNCYHGSLAAVKIAGPVNYKAIVKFVCDMAQMDFGTAADPTNIRNYYVLTILMAGLIDDIDDSVNEILRAADLPISVQIVKIGGVSESENDFGTLINRTSESFQQCERTFIDMHDFNNYKQVDTTSGSTLIKEEKLQFDLMRNIPAQIEKFFEIQHFDFDNSNAFLNSPDHTNLSSSDSSQSQNNYYNALGAAAASQLEEHQNKVISPQNNGEALPAAQLLTADNLAKRDSLMMMDEEARSNLMKEIDEAHSDDQQQLAARLKQVNLEIEEDTAATEIEESKEDISQKINNAITTINDSQRQSDLRVDTTSNDHQKKVIQPQLDYKAKILLFLEMEKLKLISEAVAAGIPEAEAQEVF